MTLPNAKKAFIDIIKLRDYCLNRNHPRGKHKAAVFNKVFGIDEQGALDLHDRILEAISSAEVIESRDDGFGEQFIVDIDISFVNATAAVRTIWIIRRGEDYPRFITCYVK